MKKILSISICFLIICKAGSQPNYNPTGNWRYVNGIDTIEVFLKTEELTAGNKTYPILIGFHRYVQNGVEKENTLSSSGTVYTQNLYSIVMFGIEPSMARADGQIKDITLNYKRSIILTKIDPTTMNVRLTSTEGRGQTGGVGYTMPRNFQLIKQ